MRTMIGIPCMDMVHTAFMASLLAMRRPADTNVHISTSSLIYDSRNLLAQVALNKGYDRLLWLDSDMKFDPDLLERLSADMDEGLDFVSALYVTRKAPIKPCAYEALSMDGKKPVPVTIREAPEKLFKIAGVGFGAVLMSTKMLRDVFEHTERMPFSPRPHWGEDLSFCLAAAELGYDLWLDGRIRVGHVGNRAYDASDWEVGA